MHKLAHFVRQFGPHWFPGFDVPRAKTSIHTKNYDCITAAGGTPIQNQLGCLKGLFFSLWTSVNMLELNTDLVERELSERIQYRKRDNRRIQE